MLVNICDEKLHYYEFVKPVMDILVRNGIRWFVRHYNEVSKNDLDRASKVIICGTSLLDDSFIFGSDKMRVISGMKKPLLAGKGEIDRMNVKSYGKSFENLEKFSWIGGFKKPLLGICGGMQVIGLVFGGGLERETEIGYYDERFDKEFLGLKGKNEVYHLHNWYVEFGKIDGFEVFAGNKVSQAVKHMKKRIYGVLFHPEVRNKDLILEFCKL